MIEKMTDEERDMLANLCEVVYELSGMISGLMKSEYYNSDDDHHYSKEIKDKLDEFYWFVRKHEANKPHNIETEDW
jgi:hypothetical protein